MNDNKKMSDKKMPIRRFKDNEEEAEGRGEFEEMFRESLQQPQVGEVVTGVIVKIDVDSVLVSVEGIKSEGRIPLDEFKDPQGEITIKQGDEVKVLLERREDRNGYPVLS